jgi:hypothetical protein
VPFQNLTQPDLLLNKGRLNWGQGSRLIHVIADSLPGTQVNARVQCVRTRFPQGDMRCLNETLDTGEVVIPGDGGSFIYNWGKLT